jgi:hypothetical protein
VTSSGPSTKHSSTTTDSSEYAVTIDRLSSTDAHSARITGPTGGTVAPASTTGTSSTGRGAPARDASTTASSSSGWTTASARSTRTGPVRSASRASTGPTRPKDRAYAPDARPAAA